MRVLHFSVNEQNIKKSGDFSGIVKGSKGYLKAEFSFGSEWSRRKAAASFFTQEKNMQSRSSGTMHRFRMM